MVIMVFCLKCSEGFAKKMWSLLVLVFAASSLVLLSMAMKSNEAGAAYSIWVAFGSIGALVLGGVAFKEKLSIKQIIYAIVIIFSVVGLKSFT